MIMSEHNTIVEETITRFAIYCRYSDAVQNDISLESQEAMCRQEIKRRNGVAVAVYQDAAQAGWSLDRQGFLNLRADAEKHHFDAIMMWKFDRLARDHNEVTMIKLLLRREYDVKLYCVEGFSEDDDNSPQTAMMEHMLAVFSAFYSKNLSTEVKRANRHRHTNGKFNGGKPPFGYLLVTEKTPNRPNCFKATPDKPPGLYIDSIPAELVRLAFVLYATGDYSYRTIAITMTEKAEYLQYPLEKPFSPEMVRDMLQNKIYCGYVSYVETVYKKGFGRGKAGSRGKRQWSLGLHEPLISELLFNKTQDVRVSHANERKSHRTARTNLLSGLVFCARCLDTMSLEITDTNYGKMYSYTGKQDCLYYECSARRRGYKACSQPRVSQASIDEQVVEALQSLHTRLSEDDLQRVEVVMRQAAEHTAALKHMKRIQEIVERIDLSWENGFMDEITYSQKRKQLQSEMEMLHLSEQDDFLKSASLLQSFDKLWERCTSDFERHKLIKQIIDRVIVMDKQVVALVLRGETAIYID
jgi:site-specific DNA recombinase